MKTSGADYLRWLLSFSTKNEKELFDGTNKLNLNPSCIKYLNTILNNLAKISTIDPEAAKKIKYDDLVDLKYSLGTVKSILLESSSNTIDRFSEVDLSLFTSCQILEISKVKPSGILNFGEMSLIMTKLCAHHTLNSLSELLDVSVEDTNKERNNKPWCNLILLDCSHNNIPEIDNTMQQLVNVQEIDLSYNIITRVNFLENCCKLRKLDLSFNQLMSVSNLHLILGNIKVLILSNNKLKTSEGLEKLYGLESLDLSWNIIAYEEDISRLKSLPLLNSLSMKGNPVALKKTYRVYVFSHLSSSITLDGEPMNKSETKKVQDITKKEFKENVNMTLTVSSVGSSSAVSVSSLNSAPSIAVSVSPTNSYLATFEPLSPSSLSYSTPIVSHKSSRQHRVAKILESNNASPKNTIKSSITSTIPTQITKTEATSLSEDFLEKLRQEYGEQWLVIFNELIRDNEQTKYQEQHRAKEPKKTNKNQDSSAQSPPTQTFDDDDESIISKAAKELLPVETNSMKENNTNSTFNISFSVPSTLTNQSVTEFTENTIENVSPNMEISEKSAADTTNIQSSTKTRTTQEEQVLVEDFYVQQRSPTGSNEERILEFKVHSNILSYGKASARSNTASSESIVMHKDDTLSELDVYTAMSVVTIPLSSLVRVELVKTSEDQPQINTTMSALSLGLAQQSGEKPVVEFEFRRDYSDRTEHEVLWYQLEDVTAQSKLFALVDPIVKFNTRDNYVRCMNCNAVHTLKYDQPKPDNCEQCQSPYIVILDENQYESFLADINSQQNTNNEPNILSEDEEEEEDDEIDMNLQKPLTVTSSVNTDTPISSTATKQTNFISDNEEFNILDDTNMQVYLRLSFMQKDKVMSMIGENILSILVCSFNYFGKSSDDEKLCYLALTNMNIYIIIQHKKPTEKDPGLTLHSQHKLSDVKTIWVGILYQNFRLDIVENGKETNTYLFITREQRKTQQFVDTLFDTMTDSLDEGCQMRFLNRQYLQSMSRLLGHLQPNFQENFQLYTMLFQNVKQSKWKPFDLNQLKMFQGGLKAFQGQLSVPVGTINIVPRSLIVTNEKLILCDEDYCHFPTTEDLAKSNHHFVVKSEHSISDLVQIELASSVSENCIRFRFETENEASSVSPPGSKHSPDSGQLWEVVLCSAAAKNALVDTVSRKWKDLFKIDLSILQN